MDKSLYYSPDKLLSYNRILNFVVGARGIGKTYGFKKYVINRFLKHGEQFIYVRRYKSELKKVKSFFDAVKAEFPDDEFVVKGREFYINKKLAGYAIPLSSWQSEKSNEYPNVNTILFDEFIREKDNSRYLPNEVESFINLMDTVIRLRNNARAICMSNSVSVVNPYFLYYSLIPDLNKRFNTTESVVIELPPSADFTAERIKTRFGKLISGTDYAKMAMGNQFVGDNYTFVEKRTRESSFVFAVKYGETTLGVWIDAYNMYLSDAYDPYCKHIYVIRKEDMTDDTTLTRGAKSCYHLKKMLSAFEKGMLKFDNIQTRSVGYEILKRL